MSEIERDEFGVLVDDDGRGLIAQLLGWATSLGHRGKYDDEALLVIAAEALTTERTARETAEAAVARLREEVERLREDCAQAYQVVGAGMFGEPVPYTQADVERVLDNLSAAASGEPRPHDDLLPWPAESPELRALLEGRRYSEDEHG